MWDFTYICILNNLPSHLWIFASMGNKQVPFAPFFLMDFFFVNMSSISLMYAIHKNHMSTSYAHVLELSLHYCSWEPCITPFGNTLLLDLTFFFKIVCMSFYRLVWCDPYLWRLQVHTSYPCALDAFVPNLCKVCFHPFVKFRKASRFAYWE